MFNLFSQRQGQSSRHDATKTGAGVEPNWCRQGYTEEHESSE